MVDAKSTHARQVTGAPYTRTGGHQSRIQGETQILHGTYINALLQAIMASRPDSHPRQRKVRRICKRSCKSSPEMVRSSPSGDRPPLPWLGEERVHRAGVWCERNRRGPEVATWYRITQPKHAQPDTETLTPRVD
jgi:hypothetical protein